MSRGVPAVLPAVAAAFLPAIPAAQVDPGPNGIDISFDEAATLTSLDVAVQSGAWGAVKSFYC